MKASDEITEEQSRQVKCYSTPPCDGQLMTDALRYRKRIQRVLPLLVWQAGAMILHTHAANDHDMYPLYDSTRQDELSKQDLRARALPCRLVSPL